MSADTPDDMMEKLPHYRAKYDEAKKVHVYFIPAIDTNQSQTMYFYAIASEMLHSEMMLSLKQGVIPHFAVVVEKGSGQPSAETKAKIKAYYGFDHDYYESQPENA